MLTFGERVGGGSFGEVFRGEYLGGEVAIKRLVIPEDQQEVMERYIVREIMIMTKIRHPNLIQLLGVALKTESEPYIVTEFARGGSLEALLQDMSARLDWKTRISFARDVSLGMRFLHAKSKLKLLININ